MACVTELADTTRSGTWAARRSTTGGLAYAMASAPLTTAARLGAAAIAATRTARVEPADPITGIARECARERAGCRRIVQRLRQVSGARTALGRGPGRPRADRARLTRLRCPMIVP